MFVLTLRPNDEADKLKLGPMSDRKVGHWNKSQKKKNDIHARYLVYSEAKDRPWPKLTTPALDKT